MFKPALWISFDDDYVYIEEHGRRTATVDILTARLDCREVDRARLRSLHLIRGRVLGDDQVVLGYPVGYLRESSFWTTIRLQVPGLEDTELKFAGADVHDLREVANELRAAGVIKSSFSDGRVNYRNARGKVMRYGKLAWCGRLYRSRKGKQTDQYRRTGSAGPLSMT